MATRVAMRFCCITLIIQLPIALAVMPDNRKKTERPPTEGKFKYHLDRTKEGKWEMRFENAPIFLHNLPIAPERLESKLRRGTWLVLAFSVSSVPDIKSIDLAVKTVKLLGAPSNLGVRPFVKYEEIGKWFPEFAKETDSPLWVIFHDGRVLAWETGPFSEAELQQFLKQAIIKVKESKKKDK